MGQRCDKAVNLKHAELCASILHSKQCQLVRAWCYLITDTHCRRNVPESLTWHHCMGQSVPTTAIICLALCGSAGLRCTNHAADQEWPACQC